MHSCILEETHNFMNHNSKVTNWWFSVSALGLEVSCLWLLQKRLSLFRSSHNRKHSKLAESARRVVNWSTWFFLSRLSPDSAWLSFLAFLFLAQLQLSVLKSLLWPRAQKLKKPKRSRDSRLSSNLLPASA